MPSRRDVSGLPPSYRRSRWAVAAAVFTVVAVGIVVGVAVGAPRAIKDLAVDIMVGARVLWPLR